MAADVELLTGERNRLIIELRACDVPFRTIAGAANLTHVGVMKIVERAQ